MKKPFFIALILALFQVGCSTVGLVYRNADWYLEHKINGYASFNVQQKDTISKEVSNYMRWHQKFALPDYILFLQNMNGAVQYQGPLKGEAVTYLRLQLMDLFRKTMDPTVQPAARIFSSMDKSQIQELEASFAKDILEQEKERMGGSVDENLDKRATKTLDFLEWLAGHLSKDQEQKIREMSRHLPFITPILIQNREANQHQLIALLNSHASPKEIAAFLSSWVVTPEYARTPNQMHAFETYEKGIDEMIVKIHALLTPKQKQHINEKISAYIKDMRSLAADVPDAVSVAGQGNQ